MRTDRFKLIDAFRNFVNTPKNAYKIRKKLGFLIWVSVQFLNRAKHAGMPETQDTHT